VRTARAGIALVVLGLALLLAPVATGAQETGGTGITGFNLDADASGVGVTFGDPKGQPYPTAAGLVPAAQTTLGDAGGHALASLAWPGPLAANVGNLSNVVLPLCIPDGDGVCSPGPGDLPPGTQQLANYPVRAEARSAGPNEVTSPGMSARALGREARAEAEVLEASSPGAFVVNSLNATARSALEEGTALATGKSTITGITVGGSITIESVTTEARASTDGQDIVTGGRTVVQGLVIDGEPATVDENGLHLGGEDSDNPLAEPEAGINEGFKDAGIEIFLTRPVERREGDVVSYRSGSLVIVWNTPLTPPESEVVQVLVVTIGGATATAQAAPGFLESLDEDLALGDDLAPLVLGDSTGGLEVLPAPVASDAAAPLAQVAGPDGAPLAAFEVEPASFFTGISPASVVLALVGALLLASGLRRVGAAAVERVPTTCPLEGRPR
jgi:hypothetical protein